MSTGRPDTLHLIADIGGTHARFALVRPGRGTPEAVRNLPAADYPDFTAAARAYLQAVDAPAPASGLCAIATPVLGDELAMTNLGWRFSVRASREALGLERLEFLNDWAAQALAVPHLTDEQWQTVAPGEPRAGFPMAVLGPGTGLGAAVLVPCARGWHAVAGEGGHVTFSPMTEREAALAAVIRAEHGHCSAERVASGLGLEAVHGALAQLDGADPEALTAADIAGRARAGDARARETVDVFTAALATTAGNLALSVGALGGVALGGGLLPRLGTLFDAAAFRRRFADKGRFSGYLAQIPVRLMRAEAPALIGLAAEVAARSQEEEHPA